VIRPALERLSGAGVPFATRGRQPIDDPPPGGDVDILIGEDDLNAADRTLRTAGFHYLRAPGHRGHRFYLAFDNGQERWLKIDVNLVPRRRGWDLSARDEEHLRLFAAYRIGTKASPGLAERVWSALARRSPIPGRRLGPVVAVLGPDGAGKGTVIATLRQGIPATVTPLYLGHGDSGRREYAVRPASSGRRAVARRRIREAARELLGFLPGSLRMAQYRLRQALGLAVRSWRAYAYAWRGDIVLCDRHPLEQLAVAPTPRGLVDALERALLRVLVPWPDAVVLLDAPGEILFERKGEHSPDVLDRWREAYRGLFLARGARVVSTTDGLEQSVAEASAVVWEALRERRGW
jgi:hypothetical protein